MEAAAEGAEEEGLIRDPARNFAPGFWMKIEERSLHSAPRPPRPGGKDKARGAALRDDSLRRGRQQRLNSKKSAGKMPALHEQKGRAIICPAFSCVLQGLKPLVFGRFFVGA